MIIIDDDSDEDDDNDDEDGCILLASLLSSASRPSPTLQFSPEETSPSSQSLFLQSSPPPSSSSSSSISDLPHKLLSPGDVDPLKDAALILFSSGTTGPPKAVLLSHHNLVAMMVLMSPKNVSENQPVCLLFYPLFHIYGLVGILFHSLYRGHKLVILPKFSLADMFKCIELHKVTMLYLVPSLVNRMIKNSEMKRDYNLSSIKFVSCGAGPLTEQSCVEFKRLYNIEDVRQGYGMTESCLASLLVDPNLPLKIGSVGHPLPNSEVVVRSLKTGETFGPNKTGEIYVRGPQVMLGYLNNQRATNEAIDQDGWLHTGDVGYYDDDGYFFIVDRIKELIKVNGYQVSPAELESIILTHPSVSDCAVVGISDNRGGEIPKAFVVKKPGYDVSAENIVNLVADHTSAYKHLKGGVYFLERLPKNEAGKILRRRLKDLPRSKL
ncbi:hypothetical protein HELRODRAFT_87823 [Helobdella robusta]|uniref:AMP-dependent synthetase/ligase domain-containing protein n=1 Tax=Helobdella robusta TaxID=6412 RepID=T1G6V8_HELRO|nr:hypothetical protein HELRODRAFT_87823 [Helobdella robusta]ESN94047.1 hypothetical protein HELRODRAFT_87823 [Helobdella robusta]